VKDLKYNNDIIKEIIKDLESNFTKKIKINEISPLHKKVVKTYEGQLVKLYNNIFSVDVFYKSYHFIKTFNYNKIVTNELSYEFLN